MTRNVFICSWGRCKGSLESWNWIKSARQGFWKREDAKTPESFLEVERKRKRNDKAELETMESKIGRKPQVWLWKACEHSWTLHKLGQVKQVLKIFSFHDEQERFYRDGGY